MGTRSICVEFHSIVLNLISGYMPSHSVLRLQIPFENEKGSLETVRASLDTRGHQSRCCWYKCGAGVLGRRGNVFFTFFPSFFRGLVGHQRTPRDTEGHQATGLFPLKSGPGDFTRV